MSEKMPLPEQSEFTLESYAIRILLNTASHPIEYAKVLIQIGFEPIAPQPCTTLFGKSALKLPNIFQYVQHIKSVDGFYGCYRGLVPKLCGNIASGIATHKIIQQLDLVYKKPTVPGEEEQQPSENEIFIRNLNRDLVTRFTAVVVSQPFHVVTIRMMAQFVGREEKYRGLFDSIFGIYRENGVLGFFSGMIPRLLGEALSIVLASTLAYAINQVVESSMKVYTSPTMSFLASALTYPFQVVSNCMAVTNSGLMAGSPPYMPNYVSWLDCWRNLSEANQLKRGSSLFFRYYNGPQVIIGGTAMPITKGQLQF